VLLVNALSRAPHLIEQMKERHAAPPVPAPRPAVRGNPPPAEPPCRRQCAANEALNALGCCERQ
jgi:hypothetical protein